MYCLSQESFCVGFCAIDYDSSASAAIPQAGQANEKVSIRSMPWKFGKGEKSPPKKPQKTQIVGVLITPPRADSSNAASDNGWKVKMSEVYVAPDDFVRNTWESLPLSKILGIPLLFRMWDPFGGQPLANKFLQIMAIDPDPKCKDAKVITGAIAVVREDGIDLNTKDTEALLDTARRYFAGIDDMNPRDQFELYRRRWKDWDLDNHPTAWWDEWRQGKVDAKLEGYEELECPVLNASSPPKKKNHPRCLVM